MSWIENLRNINVSCKIFQHVSFKIWPTLCLNVVHHFKFLFSPRSVSFSGRLMCTMFAPGELCNALGCVLYIIVYCNQNGNKCCFGLQVVPGQAGGRKFQN